MTCSDIGGCCDTDIIGETIDEIFDNGKEHVYVAADSGDHRHAELLEEMNEMSDEDIESWKSDLEQKFEEAEDAEEEF